MLQIRLMIPPEVLTLNSRIEVVRNKSGVYEVTYFAGARLTESHGGSWTTFDFKPGDKLPDEVAQCVVEATYYDNFGKGLRPHRERGIYRAHGAEAKLDDIDGGHYHVQLRGPNPEAIMSLYHDIREGVVVPVRSFEERQDESVSREELLRRLESPWRRFFNSLLDRWELFNQHLGVER